VSTPALGDVRAREGPLAKLATVLRSPALWSAGLFAAGGVGFAAGNVLLARVLPEDEFGKVALFLALTQLGIVLGPLGMETVTVRHLLGASGRLLGRVSLSSALVGLLLGGVAYALYGYRFELAAVLAATVLLAAANRVAGAFFQARRKFGLSLFLILIHNWIVLAAVPVVWLADRPEALPAALTVAAGYGAMAVVGWWKGFQLRRTGSSPAVAVSRGTLVSEGLAVVGMQLALGALFQLDRLIIPSALSIRDLATYSVVAAVAASPFRMLQTGVPFALLPRLRACEGLAAIRKLLRHEIVLAGTASVIAAAGVLLLTPWLIGVLLGSRYDFPTSLLHALVIVGFVRVWCGISGAMVAALGTTRELAHYNFCGWLALGIAVAGAFLARTGGLTGVVYGMGAGWLALALAGTTIGWRAAGSRVNVVSATPR
jgi:O-antigen/teichoic acid export membrane protein